MPPLKTKQQLAREQKDSNARERQIAKQYLQSGPSIQNLYNAFMHWYNSVPFLGGQPETGNVYITGAPPAEAIAKTPYIKPDGLTLKKMFSL